MNALPRQSGFIVLVVMIVIVMITLAGLAFVLNLSTENKAVHLQGDQLQLHQTLASGVELLRGFLDQSPAKRQLAGGLEENQAVFAAVSVAADQASAGETRFSVISPQRDGDVATGLRFGLQNESARLNLAVLSAWEEAEPGAASGALMNLPGMTEPIADAILDWLDGDATPRPAGAEAEYYASRGLPYEPRNGVPAVLDELLLIRDVSRSSLFGADINFNYRVEAAETQQLTSSAAGMPADHVPWAWLLTIYSGERNRSFDGEPRIYLNDDDLAALHERLTAAFDREAADFVVAYRQFGPVDPLAESPPSRGRGPSAVSRSLRKGARQRTRRDGEGIKLDLSVSAKYEIESILDLIDVRVVAPAEQESDEENEQDTVPTPENEVTNPFPQELARLRDYLPQWADLTTTTRDEVFRGRVNVNEAPRPVLLGVPGLDPSLVDQIISARGVSAADASPQRRNSTWLYTEGLVDLEQMRRLEPYVTCGGDVYRAQVVAVGGNSGISARAEIVLDATVSPPRQVYYKDLGLLGRGFSNEELGSSASTTPVGTDQSGLGFP